MVVAGVYAGESVELQLGVAWARALDMRFTGVCPVHRRWHEVMRLLEAGTLDPVPLVSRIGWSLPGLERALIEFERDSLAVTSLAVLDTLALAAVTSVRGVRDLVAVPLRRR